MAGNEFEFEFEEGDRFDQAPEVAVPAAGGRIWGDPAAEARKEVVRLRWERAVSVIVIALMIGAIIGLMKSGGWDYVSGGSNDDEHLGRPVGSDGGVGGVGGVGGGGSVVPAAAAARPERQECRGWVALTFDDGPYVGAGGTEEIAQLLHAWGVPGTFFFTGGRVAADGGAEAVRTVLAAGGVVGNHSWSHPRLDRLSGDEVAWELAETQRVLEEAGAGGGAGVGGLWRPPYGAVTPAVEAEAEALGLDLVLWTQDPRDWRYDGAVEAAESAEGDGEGAVASVVRGARGVRAGGILLLHDGRPVTLAALPEIIADVWARGLCFGRITAGPRAPEARLAGAPAVRFHAGAVAE